jgi:hypothetical protein
MFFRWIHDKHEKIVLLKPMYTGQLGKTKRILLHNVFSCRPSTQWFCTNTFWSRLHKQNHGYSFHNVFCVSIHSIKNPLKFFLFPADQAKTRTHHYTSQCSAARVNSNLFQTRFSRKWELMVPRLGSKCSNPWEPAIPRHGNLWFQYWEAWVPTFSNPQFLQMETLASKVGKHGFQPFGNQYFLEIGTRGSNVRKHGPQPSGARIPRTRNPCFQRLGTRSSLKWEPVVPKLGSVGSQPGELRVPKS